MLPKWEARGSQKAVKNGAKIGAKRETPSESAQGTKMKLKWMQNDLEMKRKLCEHESKMAPSGHVSVPTSTLVAKVSVGTATFGSKSY